MSRYGWMNYSMNVSKNCTLSNPIGKLTRSLISFQMILVISSPSNSTTGFLTWIFLTVDIFLDWLTWMLEAEVKAGAS